MIEPVYEDIGRSVVYGMTLGWGTDPMPPLEEGTITSFNDKYVFVRYIGQHPSAKGKATKREDLEWSHS